MSGACLDDNYNIHDTTTFSDLFNYLLESESLPPVHRHCQQHFIFTIYPYSGSISLALCDVLFMAFFAPFCYQFHGTPGITSCAFVTRFLTTLQTIHRPSHLFSHQHNIFPSTKFLCYSLSFIFLILPL